MQDNLLTLKRFFTKQEAATYTGLSQRKLDYSISRGELVAYRVGRRVLVARENLDEFIRRHQINADLNDIVNETLEDLRGGK